MFDANISRLLGKYRWKGVLLDSNLLLLLTIGTYAASRIATFKRTASYLPSDFQVLLSLLDRFDRRITTPNILTEVDNLGRQLPSHEHPRFAQILREIATTSLEVVRPSSDVMASSPYERLGLSDALSISLSSECLVVSDDLTLYLRIVGAGRDAINFNHLRL